MAMDLTSVLLGLAGAALPLVALAWQLQRRLSSRQTELSLLEERLATALLAQDGLNAQLDACRDEISDLGQANAVKQADLAAVRREVELLQIERDNARDAAHAWNLERANKEAELRRLDAQAASLNAELREQQESHQQRLSDLQGSRDELRAQFAELAGKIFDEREQRFAENSQQRLGQLLDPLKERIQSFEKRVEESYQAEARERFSLGKELERLQQLNLRLSDEATNLTRALKGQKTQGNWGELILERVLEHAGLEKGREYQTQVSLKGPDGERFQPDVLIMLPGDKQVVVDSKVSLTAYQQFVAADDEVIGQAALKQHVLSLRNHVKGLAGKDYKRLEGLHSLDFVLLFVPIEAAFSAALQAEPNLFQEAFDRNIVIVSPTTLLATLRVIDSLWKQERQSQNAREIAERAGWLYDKFVLFIQDLDEVGNRLQQLDKAYSAARNKLTEGRGNLVSRSEQLRLLGARASKSLPADLLERAMTDADGALLELPD
ncbi:DNA recombination protein RmuC [Pseudomonas sp. NFPP07]|uniref:RmuC domain protein n=1 Tax=Pseudomonas chlororaphis O6 TaxID=1037915 RepID=A0AB33WYQ5_9PSED|nr:recombinase RmuC [Pseudomonas chlororaphis]AZD23733.1 DNA recombination protein RmuC [Pseudomonas chlororaphis subsp. aurantiaca]AZD87753.1 DNA recombination protein RmuC [Pseudomonas chlororaphis subsp. aureofaciens]EIM18316.1 RmuC domain protein [Pseudomonas chlororaphis O6]PMY40755.1 DNA recombination protein RmuC [Pseudomonas sp. GW456-L14]PMY58100.1 DNA recombination protein RmuC [Pseudomonas sp. GW456-L12]POA69901.1 DNA recombination protein RmuC [Pseudomonas sp. GW531-T4]PWY48525.1